MAPPLLRDVKDLKRQMLQERKDRETESKIARNRWLAQLSLMDFLLEVSEKGEDLEAAAKRIGSAYAIASKWHRDALANQDKIKALEKQFLFSVLTVATSGLLSWASEAVKVAEAAKSAGALSKIAELEMPAAEVLKGLGLKGTAPTRHYQDLANILKASQARALQQEQKKVQDFELFRTIIKDTLAAGLGEGFMPWVPWFSRPRPVNRSTWNLWSIRTGWKLVSKTSKGPVWITSGG